MPDDVGLEPPAWWKRGCGLSRFAAPPAEASEALDHVDADPEPGHVEKLGASPMKRRKKAVLDPRLKKLVPRQGHAEVACGGEEALPVVLGDPQGHTAALAGKATGQAIRPVGGKGETLLRT